MTEPCSVSLEMTKKGEVFYLRDERGMLLTSALTEEGIAWARERYLRDMGLIAECPCPSD